MVWKDIKGYEGIYQISEYGDVRSYDVYQTRILKQGVVKIRIKSKNLSPTKINNKTRYRKIKLCAKDGSNKYKSYMIHILVYKTFIGDIEKGTVIDHIDGNRNNNHYSNLQNITQLENVRKYFNNLNVKITKNRVGYYKDIIYEDGKVCGKCKEKKPFDAFYIRSKYDNVDNSINKWRTYCKSCMKNN
jgi:hypothetical protein